MMLRARLSVILMCLVSVGGWAHPAEPVWGEVVFSRPERYFRDSTAGKRAHTAWIGERSLFQVATYTTSTGTADVSYSKSLLQRLAAGRPLVWGQATLYLILGILYVSGLVVFLWHFLRVPVEPSEGQGR